MDLTAIAEEVLEKYESLDKEKIKYYSELIYKNRNEVQTRYHYRVETRTVTKYCAVGLVEHAEGKFLRCEHPYSTVLIHLNDGERLSFKQIVDVLDIIHSKLP